MDVRCNPSEHQFLLIIVAHWYWCNHCGETKLIWLQLPLLRK